MTNNEILEGNKLIAQFMKLHSAIILSDASQNEDGIELAYSYNKRAYLLSQLEYHFNWDWLMPVVEKILSSKFSDGESVSFRTFSINDAQKCGLVRINRFTLFCENTLIESVYMAVIDVVKWHNQPKD